MSNRYTLHHGDCIDVMRTMPDASVDAIVTDPPYELGLMGKSWDASGIAFNPDVWREALRVLKPGGHLLAFSGSRTYHRMAVAIEDAGFEIRDQIQWIYGSGFPKSLDVSKAIDKGSGENRARQLRFTEWMRSTGMTAKQANRILQDAGAISSNGTMAGHYFDKTQPAIATADLFDLLRPYLPEVPEEIDRLVAERTGIEWTAYKQREVVGSDTKARSTSGKSALPTLTGSTVYETWDITAPATPAARQWQGWGTALKPAHEPIVLARKPLIGTVAANVLAHGTGALNIDGTRVGTDGGGTTCTNRDENGACRGHDNAGRSTSGATVRAADSNAQGRWPANVIHDGSDEAVEHFGDAHRFFYCAKASKRDRNEGLDESKNHHPTVKPTDLMRYLIRLITPPQGVVLDPFMGSGSTGKAAMLESNRFIGIEQDADYLAIAEARIRHAANTEADTLFGAE